MIKPRSLPSHFKLQAEAQPGNFEGKTNSHSFDSFNQLNGNSMLPVTPMTSVTTSTTTDRDSKVSETTNPIISTEAPQPTMSGATSMCSFNTTKRFPQIHQRCSSRLIHSIQEVTFMEYSGYFVCVGFAVDSVGLLVLSVLSVWTCETWNYVEYSSPLVYSKFYSSDT